MTATNYPRGTDAKPTVAYPIVQRSGIRFFRRVSRSIIGVFLDIGHRVFFARDILRAFGDPATYVPLTIKQMRNIGVDFVPIAASAAFMASHRLRLTYHLSGYQLRRRIIAPDVHPRSRPAPHGAGAHGRMRRAHDAESTSGAPKQIDALDAAIRSALLVGRDARGARDLPGARDRELHGDDAFPTPSRHGRQWDVQDGCSRIQAFQFSTV